MMRRKIVWLIIGLVGVVGVIFSWRDYRVWHAQEIGKFGQGSVAEEGLAAPKTLALPYSAFIGGFRLKPPVDWTITENLTLKNMHPSPVLPTRSLAEIVRFKDPSSTAQVVVYVQHTAADLTGLVNAHAMGTTQDRSYISVGTTPMTILTWTTPDAVTQKAMLSANDNFIIIEASVNASAWKTWAKTFDAIYQSWTKI